MPTGVKMPTLNTAAGISPTNGTADMMLLPSPTGQPYQTAADLMYITWENRQLALAYSATLEVGLPFPKFSSSLAVHVSACPLLPFC